MVDVNLGVDVFRANEAPVMQADTGRKVELLNWILVMADT